MDCDIADDLDRRSRSFRLFSSKTNCSLLFSSLIEVPGDLAKDDIADDLKWHLKVFRVL